MTDRGSGTSLYVMKRDHANSHQNEDGGRAGGGRGVGPELVDMMNEKRVAYFEM